MAEEDRRWSPLATALAAAVVVALAVVVPRLPMPGIDATLAQQALPGMYLGGLPGPRDAVWLLVVVRGVAALVDAATAGRFAPWPRRIAAVAYLGGSQVHAFLILYVLQTFDAPAVLTPGRSFDALFALTWCAACALWWLAADLLGATGRVRGTLVIWGLSLVQLAWEATWFAASGVPPAPALVAATGPIAFGCAVAVMTMVSSRSWPMSLVWRVDARSPVDAALHGLAAGVVLSPLVRVVAVLGIVDRWSPLWTTVFLVWIGALDVIGSAIVVIRVLSVGERTGMRLSQVAGPAFFAFVGLAVVLSGVLLGGHVPYLLTTDANRSVRIALSSGDGTAEQDAVVLAQRLEHRPGSEVFVVDADHLEVHTLGSADLDALQDLLVSPGVFGIYVAARIEPGERWPAGVSRWEDLGTTWLAGRDGATLRSVPLPPGTSMVLRCDRPERCSGALLAWPPIVSNDDVAAADVVLDPATQEVSVSVSFDPDGAQRFGAATAAHLGEQLFIVSDDRIVSAPLVMEAIRGGVVAIHVVRAEEAWPLARLLRARALSGRWSVDAVEVEGR